jgi:ABC-type ATPase involved in cell division
MIKIEKLFKVFLTDEVETTALNNIDIHIQQGEFVAIMGLLVVASLHCSTFLVYWKTLLTDYIILPMWKYQSLRKSNVRFYGRGYRVCVPEFQPYA